MQLEGGGRGRGRKGLFGGGGKEGSVGNGG